MEEMMGKDKSTLILLTVFIILNSLHVISLMVLTVKSDITSAQSVREDPNKTKSKNAGGGTYKTKEEIEKAPSDDHPCNLTRTSVRITFPDLRGELFVNLLGYKEPNLVPLMRCIGRCGENRKVACVPTQVQERVMNMVVRSHLQGQESKVRFKEITLKEHTECGCQCQDQDMSALICGGTFSAEKCECKCEGIQSCKT